MAEAVLRLANFVTGGDCATIQNTAQLAKLAYGSFEVNDPLGWDILDTLKLLACLVEQLGCSINFTGTDLTVSLIRVWYATDSQTLATVVAPQ